MEVERQNKMVEQEVCSRLNIGGKWYYRGDTVRLDAADAEVYQARGLTRPPKPKKPAVGSGEKEAFRPEQVPVQTKVIKPEESAEPPSTEGTAEEKSQPSLPAEDVVLKDTGMTKPEETLHGRNKSTGKHR